MSKQTALEWLLDNMPDISESLSHGQSLMLHARFQQAKAMEKEQMKAIYGQQHVRRTSNGNVLMDFEDYYHQTYGKGEQKP